MNSFDVQGNPLRGWPDCGFGHSTVPNQCQEDHVLTQGAPHNSTHDTQDALAERCVHLL